MSDTYTVRIHGIEIDGEIPHADVILDGGEVHVRGLTRDNAIRLASAVVIRGGHASVWGEQASAVTVGPGARLTIGTASDDFMVGAIVVEGRSS